GGCGGPPITSTSIARSNAVIHFQIADGREAQCFYRFSIVLHDEAGPNWGTGFVKCALTRTRAAGAFLVDSVGAWTGPLPLPYDAVASTGNRGNRTTLGPGLYTLEARSYGENGGPSDIRSDLCEAKGVRRDRGRTIDVEPRQSVLPLTWRD